MKLTAIRMDRVIERGAVRFEGDYRWRRYWAVA